MDEKMIDGLRQEIKKDVGKWEEALLKWAYKVGRQVAVVLLKVEGCRGTCGSSGGCIRMRKASTGIFWMRP